MKNNNDNGNTVNNVNNANKRDKSPNDFKKLGKFGEKLTKLFQSNKPNGYALILAVLFFFYLGIMFTKPIIITNINWFMDINLVKAKRVAEYMGVAVASPVRNYITNTIHPRIQQQYIQHLALNRSSSETYPCQNSLFPTMQNGGDLRNQFGLCDPLSLFDGMNGDTNQSIPFADFLYPNHKTELSDPKLNRLRKSVVEQAENNYDYTLRTIFVGQDSVGEGVDKVNRYRYLSRADIETRTYFGVRNHMVAQFDVVIEEKYYSTPFNGGGDNCDLLGNAEPEPMPGKGIVFTQPDGSTLLCGQDLIDCQPLGVVDVNGVLQPYGSKDYKKACGDDPYCGQGATGAGSINNANCGTNNGSSLECSGLANGSTYIGTIKPLNVRVRRGCASISSGQSGTTTVDPDGYIFTVVTRLVSIGTTFN